MIYFEIIDKRNYVQLIFDMNINVTLNQLIQNRVLKLRLKIILNIMLILTILTKELMLTETIDEILNLKIQSFY